MQKKKKFDGIAKQALDFPLGSNLRGEAYKGNRAERGEEHVERNYIHSIDICTLASPEDRPPAISFVNAG